MTIPTPPRQELVDEVTPRHELLEELERLRAVLVTIRDAMGANGTIDVWHEGEENPETLTPAEFAQAALDGAKGGGG
jgi:hypothetical protein